MLYPVGAELQHRDGFRLTVSQRYDDQVVLQRGGMDYCRASVEEVQRYTRPVSMCECEHREHFPDNDACPADCEACGADAHALIAHPYGGGDRIGLVRGPGGLHYCRACTAHAVAASRFAPLACGHVEGPEHFDRYEVDGAFICSKCFDAEVVRAVLAECACGGCYVVAR